MYEFKQGLFRLRYRIFSSPQDDPSCPISLCLRLTPALFLLLDISFACFQDISLMSYIHVLVCVCIFPFNMSVRFYNVVCQLVYLIAVGCSSLEIYLTLFLDILYLSCSYIFALTSKAAMTVLGCALQLTNTYIQE